MNVQSVCSLFQETQAHSKLPTLYYIWWSGSICTRISSKVHHCPMLSHLPREARVKFIKQLTNYCQDCLRPQDRRSCSHAASDKHGICTECKKSVYVCGHRAAEDIIEIRRQKYNAIYREIQSQHFPWDLIGPKVSQKTSTIYALFSKTNTLLPHQWQ